MDERFQRLSVQFETFCADAICYFDDVVNQFKGDETSRYQIRDLGRDYYWDKISQTTREAGCVLIERLLNLSGDISSLVRVAPLATDGDLRSLAVGTKSMRAALHFREYRFWNADVLHDEGVVLGVTPAGQSDDWSLAPSIAKNKFEEWASDLRDILALILSGHGNVINAGAVLGESTRYRPNTAFIMMAMNTAKPELNDVVDAVKQVFDQFGIKALRVDDIEYDGKITEQIMSEIASSEFLFADLTDERPNVYYEVGYAHAIKKRVMLYRKTGTNIHFDLAGYNCIEYDCIRDLKDKLNKRLSSTINRNPN